MPMQYRYCADAAAAAAAAAETAVATSNSGTTLFERLVALPYFVAAAVAVAASPVAYLNLCCQLFAFTRALRCPAKSDH